MTDRAREVLAEAYRKAGMGEIAWAINSSDKRSLNLYGPIDPALAAMSTYAAEREAAEREACARAILAHSTAYGERHMIHKLAAIIRSRSEASAPQPMAEWIEWNGGECPVPEGALVEVKWSNGSTDKGVARLWRWSHEHRLPFNLTAYRLVPSQPDTGTKDRLEEIVAIIKHGLQFGDTAKDILSNVADALQRLSKGKNDDR